MNNLALINQEKYYDSVDTDKNKETYWDNDIWDIILDENSINEDGLRNVCGNNISVNGRSAIIMVKK